MLGVEGLRGLGRNRQDVGDPDVSRPGELERQSRAQPTGCHRVDEVNCAKKLDVPLSKTGRKQQAAARGH